MIDWLATYLGNLTIRDASGLKNQNRVKLRILDAFNELLYPDEKPKITKVLLKEFVIQ